MTSNYVPGLRLEFAQFYGETGHFKLNFSFENSNFSQFFVSGIYIHTFSHNSAEKKFRFICTLIVALNEFKIASSIPDSLSTVLFHCLCQKRCIMWVLLSWQEIFAGHFYNKTSYQSIDCENLNDYERSMDSLKSMFSSLCL